MKGLLVFNEFNDIVFVGVDADFKKHVFKLATDAELIQEGSFDVTDDLDPNVVLQLFSPLVASQRFMAGQLKNPYAAIHCENGTIYVLKQFGDQLHVAINGDGSETEEFLHRKLLVFHRILGFLYGPITEEVCSQRSSERQQRWTALNNLLNTWCNLVTNDQSFLVEAIERLHVNEMLNAKCLQLLEAALTRVRQGGDKYTQHTLLLVNSKLLALYSNRNAYELQSADILLMTLLVKKCFPSTQTLEDLFSTPHQRTPSMGRTGLSSPVKILNQPDNKNYDSYEEGEDENYNDSSESEPDAYYSSHSTPPESTPERKKGSPHSLSDMGIFEGDRVSLNTPLLTAGKAHGAVPKKEGRSTPKTARKGDEWLPGLPEEGATSQGPRAAPSDPSYHTKSSSYHQEEENFVEHPSDTSSTMLEDFPEGATEPEWTNQDERSEYQRQTVFLQTPVCRFTPHTLHCIEIAPGCVLLVICEMFKGKQSGLLYQTLVILRSILNQNRVKGRIDGKYLLELLDVDFRRIAETIKKFRGTTEKIMIELKKKWEQCKKAGFLAYVESEGNEIPPRLEGPLTAVYRRLKDLFKLLYVLPRVMSAEQYSLQLNTILDLQAHVRHQLRDYMDYLNVKAQRNITMTNYLEEFPGLIHFIYVDRTTDQITAPSINVTRQSEHLEEEGEERVPTYKQLDATQILKNKIWGMVNWAQVKLQDGHVSMALRDGDFHFSYFLWFEDNSGNPLNIQQAYRGSHDDLPPGILPGNFYKTLVRQCFPNAAQHYVHCYEVMCLHVGLTPTQYAMGHCRKLAAMLWETSGEAHSPISLL